MPKRKFLRRLYTTWDEFTADLGFIMSQRPLMRRAFRDLVTPDFRERLMLVVTQVNGCRYCEYGHLWAARQAGVPQEQLDALISGLIPDSAPPEEITALLYARHWAERNTHPNLAVVAEFESTYGAERAAAIHLLLRMIRVGNLLGNLGDYLLYRITFGLAGLRHNEQRYAA